MSARLDLKFSFQCNNRCVFCVQGDKRDYEPDKTAGELRMELRDHRDRCSGVVFTGGEVTLREDLPQMVRYARELGYSSVQVQTNGRRLSYAPYAKELLEAGVTEFAPALHGADAQTHDALVRAKGAFKQTARGIQVARKLGAPVILNSVVLRQNYRQLPRMARLFAQLERFCAEAIMPDTAIVDGGRKIDNYAAYRWNDGKARGPQCGGCSYKAMCEGPWREYPAHFGWDEFVPRKDPPMARVGQLHRI